MRLWMLVLGWLMAFATYAQGNSVERYQAGVHYKVLPEAIPTLSQDKIEVTEAFSYGCGHCYNFEPRLLAWEKTAADDVQLVKLPVIWRDSMQPFARIMYTGEALGIANQVNDQAFRAIHTERKNLNSENVMVELFASLGVEKEKFYNTYKSFSVSSKVHQAQSRTRSIGVSGIPEMLVDGRYLVSARTLSHNEVLEVVDFLIEKVRSEKAPG